MNRALFAPSSQAGGAFGVGSQPVNEGQGRQADRRYVSHITA